MTGSLGAALRDELVEFLSPLGAVRHPTSYAMMLRALGHTPAMAANTNLHTALAGAADAIEALAAIDLATLETWDGATKALKSGAQAIAALKAAEHAILSTPLASEAEQFGLQLATRLVSVYLRSRHARLHRIAALLGLIDPLEVLSPVGPTLVDGQITRLPWRDDVFRLDRLEQLLSDPWGALARRYLPNGMAVAGDAHQAAALLFPMLTLAAEALGLRTLRDLRALGPSPPDVPAPDDFDIINTLDHFPTDAPLTDEDVPVANPLPDDTTTTFERRNMPRLTLVLEDAGGAGRLGVSFVASSAEHDGGVAGLLVGAAGRFAGSETRGGWTLEAATSGDLPAFAIGRGGLRLVNPASAGAGATGHISIAKPHGAAPAFRVGDPKGSRLEVGDLKAQIDFVLKADQQRVGFTAKAENARLVIASEGNGLLAEVLPAGGASFDFDLSLTLFSDGGLDVGVGLHGLPPAPAMPVGKSLGPLMLQSITRDLRTVETATGKGLTLQFGFNLSFNLGPVSAALTGPSLGVDLLWSLKDPAASKNLGIVHLDGLGLRAPTGVGLAIDAHGVLTGGGFLALDPASGNYGGVLQMTLHDKISLAGYGLIATKMPDGGPGFSLLVFVTADGFQPIPLGFGLMLQSIGGMLGIHRTFDKEVLRGGLKSDTLATLLFPRDPVGNAPALLSALAAAFPIRRGSYLFGLLARITWFTPTLITLDLALILELGARTRLLVLGRVSALLPSRENDLIRINLDTIGVLDFDEGSFEADAVLVDSRIARQFPVTGSAALRARWGGSNPTFVMAVGGFNPRFAPPAGFPTLDRVTIALCSGSNPRLICDSYFAITANTVQFGAHASLYAEAAGFSVSGDLGFDALVTLDPPHFIVDLHASVQLKRGSHNLFKVTIDGTLEGPVPLRLAAKASFEILWFTVSVHFDYTLVGGDAGQGRPSVRLEDEVKRALINPANWSTRTGLGHGVALRSLPPSANPVLDPLGQLVVQQQVAPLNTQRAVNTYGGVRVAGPQRFKLTGAFDGQAGQPVQAEFAPARYFGMSDDEKLVAPSFDSMDAGVVLGDDNVAFDATTIAEALLDYDEFVLNPVAVGTPAPPTPKPVPYSLPASSLGLQAVTGAAARSPARQAGRQRFANPDVAPAATLHAARWQVAQAYGEAKAPAQAPTTWSEGRAAVVAMKAGDRWVLAPSLELQA